MIKIGDNVRVVRVRQRTPDGWIEAKYWEKDCVVVGIDTTDDETLYQIVNPYFPQVKTWYSEKDISLGDVQKSWTPIKSEFDARIEYWKDWFNGRKEEIQELK